MDQSSTISFHGDNTFTTYTNGKQSGEGHWTSEGNLKYLLTARNQTTAKDDSFMLDMTSDHKSVAYELAPMFSFIKE